MVRFTEFSLSPAPQWCLCKALLQVYQLSFLKQWCWYWKNLLSLSYLKLTLNLRVVSQSSVFTMNIITRLNNCRCLVAKMCPTLLQPCRLSPTRLPLSVGFSRQEYWSVLSFPSPGDLSNSEIEPRTPGLAGRFFTTEPPGKPNLTINLQSVSRLPLK